MGAKYHVFQREIEEATSSTGALIYNGKKRAGVKLYPYFICKDCGEEYPEIHGKIRCNGWVIDRCPYCKKRESIKEEPMSTEKARQQLDELIEDYYKEAYITLGLERRLKAIRKELEPEPRIIDWQKVVDNRLPVSVADVAGATWLAFLYDYRPEQRSCFWSGSFWTAIASLETGQWVFNSTGKNVWPEGVRFEVWLQGGSIKEASPGRPSNWDWSKKIIASRAVGLEEGWSYGGGE